MAVQELAPDEELDFDGVHIVGEYDEEGESHTFVVVNGWARREFVLEVDGQGAHVDFLEFEREAPPEENTLVLGVIAKLARAKNKEVITVEDMDGNLF